MNRIVRVGTTLRNHWKKSVLLSVAAGYGANWYKKKLEDTALMKECCREALNYGVTTQGVNQPNYHVTVILNPAASGGNGRKLFEKYSAPLLHLAGCKVSVQLTEGREEAKELMKIMENTDAVLVAGGDGTLMEALTGMMRRSDVEVFSRVPIGVVPVGENNTLAQRLFPCGDQVRQMTEATMSVIKQLKKTISILEVENLGEVEELRGKKIYGFNGLEMGAWREAYNRRGSYWLFGGLKHRLSYIFGYLTGHKEINWTWPLELSSTTTETVTRQMTEKPRGIFALFYSPKTVEKVERVEQWRDEDKQNYSQIEVKINNEEKILEGRMFPSNLTFSEFVEEGLRRLKPDPPASDLNLQEFKSPPASALNLQEFRSNNFKLDTGTSEESPRGMSLDGEEVELVGTIRVYKSCKVLEDERMEENDGASAIEAGHPTVEASPGADQSTRVANLPQNLATATGTVGIPTRSLQGFVQKTREGVLNHYAPTFQNIQKDLERLNLKQEVLTVEISTENYKIRKASNDCNLDEMISVTLHYKDKLESLKSCMISLSDRSASLRERACKLQEQKQVEALKREARRAQLQARDQLLIAKDDSDSS